MQALPTDNLGGRKNCITDKVGPLIIILCDTQFQQRVDFVLNFLQCSYLLRPNAVHINLHVMPVTKSAPNNHGRALNHHQTIPLLLKDQIWRLRLILHRGQGITVTSRTTWKWVRTRILVGKIRILLKFLKQQVHEETMSTAYSLVHIYLVVFLFVDYIDLFTPRRPT